MVDTNVTAVAILTKLFAAGMVERNRGHIINISSVAAHHAYPGTSSNSLLKPDFCKMNSDACKCDILDVIIEIACSVCLNGEAQVLFVRLKYFS